MKKQKSKSSPLLKKELQKLVKEKSAEITHLQWELVMEASLKSTLGVALNMKKPGDLTTVCQSIYKELIFLGFENIYNVRISIKNISKPSYSISEYSEYNVFFIENADYKSLPLVSKAFSEPAAAKDVLYQKTISGKEFKEWRTRQAGLNKAADSRVKEMSSIHFYLYPIGTGHFDMSTFSAITKEQLKILKRFRDVLELSCKKYEDLIRAETYEREADIEVSLDKVRSKALTMQKTDDFAPATAVVFTELSRLKLGILRCGIGIIDKEKISANVWTTTRSDNETTVQVSGDESMTIHPLLKGAYDAWIRQEEDYSYELGGEDLVRFYEALARTNFQLPDAQGSNDLPATLKQYYYVTTFQYGGLYAFRDELFDDEVRRIMKRFAGVFNLTYKRFIDLQKAEAQARDAQIEAALERVRAGAMEMQKSDDMADAVSIIFEELDKLDLGMLRCGIGILNNINRTVNVWASTKSDQDTPLQISGDESMDAHPLLQGAFNAWLRQEDYSYVLEGQDLANYYKTQWSANFKLPESQSLLEADEKICQYYFLAIFQSGGIFAFRESVFPEEAKKVMKRFAGVFNLTYKRFQDLKKAEAQARRAQIEATLERVRSGSLSMHKSDELKDVVKVVFENLRSLGLQKIDAVNINIFHEGSKVFDLWIAAPGQDYTRNFRLPYFDHPIANDFFDSVKSGKNLHKKIYPYEQKNEYFKYMFEHSDNKYLPEERKTLILNGPAYAVSAALSDRSALFIHNYQGEPFPADTDEILIRFSNVFDQAYKRYLDLQKAELLVKEALKQASLDRLRGQVASMRATEDLQRITPLIWQELSHLEIIFIRCGVFIFDEAQSAIRAYLSTPPGQSLGVLHLPFDNDELTKKTVDCWRRQQVLRHHWNKVEFLQWMQSIIDRGQISDTESFREGVIPPDSLDLHFVPFTQGMLYVGGIQPLSAYELDLVKSLAESFSIAYARYEDFTRLEKAKMQTEKALQELKQTQSQLIHSEKMASLGELTAGIAHEIQNPLNFINNFSEVNKELIEELKEEKSKLKNQRNEQLEIELLNDIAENELKIIHHGKRADDIVKGMLQHSRKTTGQKEPTDINALAEEYLRFSYHGLVAKDKSFNATIVTDFDDSIGDIDTIQQDFGRALLNFYNNAFYAVSAKKKLIGEDYEPTVTVETKRSGDKVQIKIKDNGMGIPQKVVDKIFQPFFTTKPTGQGTGLGLSLSYDIVKAHGAEIKVETEEGECTTFIVELKYS